MRAMLYGFAVLAFFTLVSSSEARIASWPAGISPRVEEDDALAFIKCVHKALDGGLPSADIPTHNPLKIRNITQAFSLGGLSVNLTVYDTELDDLLVYNVSNVNGILYENMPEKVYYTYDIYWPSLTLKGKYVIALGNLDHKGDYNFDLVGLDFAGFWNMTMPNQTVQEHLDEYEINISVEDVKADVDGLLNNLVEGSIAEGLKVLLNNVPKEQASEALKARFNDAWLSQPERINAIMENCKSS